MHTIHFIYHNYQSIFNKKNYSISTSQCLRSTPIGVLTQTTQSVALFIALQNVPRECQLLHCDRWAILLFSFGGNSESKPVHQGQLVFLNFITNSDANGVKVQICSNGCLAFARALTNTVGGDYEYIHEYRVMNINTVFALVFRSFKQNVNSRDKNAS